MVVLFQTFTCLMWLDTPISIEDGREEIYWTASGYWAYLYYPTASLPKGIINAYCYSSDPYSL